MTEEYLISIISKADLVINGLENSEAFRIVVEDFKKEAERADGAWHLLRSTEEKQFDDLRVMKLAAVSIVDVIENYKHDKEQAMKQLEEIKNPQEYQTGYTDNE